MLAILALFLLPAVAGAQNVYHTPQGVSPHPVGWAVPARTQMALDAPFALSASAATTMYDSIDVKTVPASPAAVAGYTAGWWPTYLPLVKAFPHAVHLSIAISARYHANCLDVESGDAFPSQVVAWIIADRAAGFAKPCVYSSLYEFVSQIRPLIAAAHIARSSIIEWDADYTYVPHIDAGFDGTQYTDRALGRNLDASLVTSAMLAIGQHPAPKPKPVRVHCWGPHAQLHSKTCAVVRPEVARLVIERNQLLAKVPAHVHARLVKGHVVLSTDAAGVKLERSAEALNKRINALIY